MHKTPLIIILFSLCALVAVAEETIPHTPVFVSGEGGYHTYRIPSLLVTREGTLLAFCEGRKHSSSDTGDIDLILRRSTDQGQSWSPQSVVWDDSENTCGNPCPVQDEATGVIYLLLTHNPGDTNEGAIIAGKGTGTRSVWVCQSRDDGLSWTAPTEITSSVKKQDWSWYATGPGIGIQLRTGAHAGRMIIPCDHMTLGDTKGYFSHAIYSDDHGATWKIGGSSGDGANECQVIERNSGELLLNMRRAATNDQDGRVIATSGDSGETWTPNRHDSALTEPRCQASLIRYATAGSGDKRLLFSNPADPKKRVHFTVRMSEDEGQNWQHTLELFAGPSAYSCLGVLSNRDIACLYERGQKHPYESIVLAHFPLHTLKPAL